MRSQFSLAVFAGFIAISVPSLVTAKVTAQQPTAEKQSSAPVPEWLGKVEKALGRTDDVVEAIIEYRPDSSTQERQAQAQAERAMTSEIIKSDISRSGREILGYLQSQGVEIIKIFEYQPLIRVRVSLSQARQLAERQDIVSLHLESFFQREETSITDARREEARERENLITDDALPQTNPEYVNADKVWAKGFQGAGYAVAVLDDGINSSHEMFAGKLLAEACFSNSSAKGVSLCPNGATNLTGTGAASRCSTENDVCGHGSHVAGIAVGNNHGTIFNAKGVAPEGKLVAVQVFTRQVGVENCTGGATSCVLASNFDISAALDWVIANASRYNISAVNLSLGSGSYSSYCDSQTILTTGVNALRKLNVLTAIAAGNDGDLGVVTHPGCIRNAVTVSSTIITVPDSGVNQAPMVDLVAPGFLVYSALGSGTASYGSKSGTSMATPYVAGAIALLKSALPSATADQIEYAMLASGPLVNYIGWTWKTPRLDANAAVNILGATPPPQGIALAGIFSGATSVNSFIRFMNVGTSTGHAHITMILDTPKTVLGTYDVNIPPNASVQVAAADIEKAIKFPGSAETMSAYVDADFKGYLQNVVFNQASGAFTNLTACSSTLVDLRNFMGSAHTPKLGPNYPSAIFVHNSGNIAAKAGFDIFDGPSGIKLGSIDSALVQPNTSESFTVADALDSIGFTAAQDHYQVNFKLQSGFRGFTGHIVLNAISGVFTDMSAKCPI